MTERKKLIVEVLRKWINQNPGLDFADYGNRVAFNAERRAITKTRIEALELLRYVERSSITCEALEGAFSAYSGRLKLVEDSKGLKLDYCTGQYWPTEYRKATCAILSLAIWRYFDAECGGKPKESAMRQFSRSTAKKWFN